MSDLSPFAQECNEYGQRSALMDIAIFFIDNPKAERIEILKFICERYANIGKPIAVDAMAGIVELEKRRKNT